MHRVRSILLLAVTLGSCAKPVTVTQPHPPSARAHAVIPLPDSIEISPGEVFAITADTAI
jgi:hypothetical protein